MKNRLELTWIGKENRPKLEPRILLEGRTKSYLAKHRVSDRDMYDNLLVFGDNLLALKALEQDFAGKIKCIYIDPPFNTGAAFEHYDDSLEHSIWLGLMRDRFEILRRLLRPDGLFFLHLDDNETAYARVLCDEVFGRSNYRNTFAIKANSPFGFKHTSDSVFRTVNYVLAYAASPEATFKKVFIERGYDEAYRFILDDRAAPYTKWRWRSIQDVVASDAGFATSREARKEVGPEVFGQKVADFAVGNAERVFRTAAVSGGARQKRLATLQLSAKQRDKVLRHPNDDMDYYFIGGERVLFYNERLVDVDGRRVPGEVVTDLWTDISWEGIASEGGVDFPKGKKPERLLQRVAQLATDPGDWILDSFAGSGTTGAVAQKMGRRWIMVELGEHCHTHIIPRMKKVINGEDKGGITEAVGWKGGGGFRYYRLAPSLLEKDKWGNWVINKEYNAAMLAEALCKLEGFTYAPSDSVYWQQGRSTERDFIYITTAKLSHEQLQQLSDEVGTERSLLVLCTAFRGKGDYPNLTVKKIPKQVLSRCEWGHDDYSLQVENLPKAPPEKGQQGLFGEEPE
jgi:adenine-specific DNA-methyltransferase